MSSEELEYYLISTGLFNYNSNKKRFFCTDLFNLILFEVGIVYYEYGDKRPAVEFRLNDKIIDGYHMLDELNFKSLSEELSKMLSGNECFIKWYKKNNRDFNIEKIIKNM